MDLIQVRNYIRERQMVSLKDLVIHFNQQADTVRPLVATWISKGKVRHLHGEACKKGCCACDPETLEMYEWVE